MHGGRGFSLSPVIAPPWRLQGLEFTWCMFFSAALIDSFTVSSRAKLLFNTKEISRFYINSHPHVLNPFSPHTQHYIQYDVGMKYIRAELGINKAQVQCSPCWQYVSVHNNKWHIFELHLRGSWCILVLAVCSLEHSSIHHPLLICGGLCQ